MRIAALSDQHGNLPEVPDCDLLIIAGDVCPFGGVGEQLGFLNGPFREWLEGARGRRIPVVGIAGNHDTIFERERGLVPSLPWLYLEDSGVVPDADYRRPDSYEDVAALGVRIWGTPWSLEFGAWAFMRDENFLAERFSHIPDDTNVIISHGPPYGYGDKVQEGFAWTSQGSHSLLNKVRAVKPRLVVFGHIHEGRGMYDMGGPLLVNATIVDRSLRPVYSPMVFDLDFGA